VSGAIHTDPRTTRGMPGSRAPHVWLTRSQERVSPHDLVGNFVLFTGPGRDADWRSAAAVVARELGDVPLDVFCVGRDLGDPDGQFCQTYGLSDSGASLVRPDGFVAWRAERIPADPRAALHEALARHLATH
jgi:putative polyketide hydroxylase